MNALCYKIVFSKRLGTLVAVGEHTAGQGKAAGTGVRTVVFPSSSAASADNFVGLLKSVFASVALSFVTVGYATAAGPAVNTLPTGYSVNSGNVAISSTSSATNAAMTIQQTTDKASVNWNSFSIGSGAAVNVQQNNANSVLLNRVVGNDPSQIFGKLTANGQVILINPNGVVFGKGGSVTASAFTASTFGMTDADFNNGKHKFSHNGKNNGVTVESGATIDTTGYVALIGASVDNQGAITTQGGAVVLAAGDSVALPSALTDNISVPLSGKVRLELLPSTLNAMVANSGTITTDGGQVLMQAAALSDAVASITHTGTIDTTGVQGGAVTLQADHGIIKATGNIKANSKNAKNKGGDIVIGRDEETGVLARSTDVRGAHLESLGGFVETSGDYLKTDGISVKAKDWLLDPTDINIRATATTTLTASSSVSGTTTFIETAGINTSEVLTGTIKSAIDNGTNVTISTANSVAGANGSGNITIVDKLDFANNSGQDAKLTLLAKNGITQNAGATIIQTAGSNNNKVDVVMTSEGLHGGNNAPSISSRGITLNAAITTNGDVTLNGTTNNSGAVSNLNAIGVDTNTGASIIAKNISITGSSQSSFGIQSRGTLTATGNITLNGTSKNFVGVVTNGSIDAGGALNITGIKTTASGYQGVNIASNLKGNSIDITGTGMNYDAVQFNNNVQVESATTLNVTGNSTSAKGVYFLGTGNTFKAASYTMKGTSGAGAGNYAIYFGGNTTFTSTSTTTNSLIEGTKTTLNSGDTIFNAGTLTINSGAGKAVLQTSTSNVGGGIRINGGSTVNTTGDVTIGSKNSSNSSTFNQGTINAEGNLKLLGQINSNNGTDAGVWLQNAGTADAKIIGASGANITIDGTNLAGGAGVNLSVHNSANSITTTGTSSTGAVGNISITGTSASGHGISNAATTISNTSTSAGAKGNVTLTGTTLAGTGQGIYNVAAGMNAGLNVIYAAGDLTLKGTSVNGNAVNTTGTLEAGGLLKIEGTAIPTGPLLNATSIGIYVGNTVKGGTVSMTGTTGGSKGVDINGAVTSTVGDITLTGTGGGNYHYGQGVLTEAAGSLNSAAGITIKGTATASGNNLNTIGTQIQGSVTAVGDILVEGKNTGANTPNFGLSIENSIKSTGGNITVTAENTSGTKTALSQSTAGRLLTDNNSKAININTNGMDLAAGAVVQAGTSGTGTVNIKTIGNNNISIGSGDTPNNSAAGQTLGISQAELNQIQAGNVLIGDTSKTGNITISGAVSTASATGNITLQTGRKISVDQALTIADTKNLTLQAIGDVTIGAEIKWTGAGALVIAAGLGKDAGDDTGGQVTRANSFGKITNTSGNTYIYTGNVAGSATMSQLNSAFSTLTLGTNAQSYIATALSTPLSSSANTQVLYREKIAVNLSGSNSLANAVKTYGDVSKPTVNTDAQTALKTANANKTLRWTQAGNSFNLSSDTLVDTLSVNGAAYSTADKLKASGTAYGTSSSAYSVTSPQTLPTLKIEQKTITTAQIANAGNTYGGPVAAGAVTLGNDVITNDVVTAAATIDGATLTANKSSSGNLKAATYGQTVATTALGDTDAGNYKLDAPVAKANSYTVTQKSLTALYAANNKAFDGNTTATLVSATLQDKVASDVVTPTNTSATFDTAAVGTDKTVTVTGIKLTGADAGNYTVAPTATTTNKPSITTAPIKPPSPVVPTDSTPRVKIPVGSANPFALASAEDLADETCSANSIENCYCEASPISANVDICYEPKAGAKSAAR